MSSPKIYLVAGEHSGDTHGADLIKDLLEKNPSCTIRFMGGDLMKNAGGTLAFHYKDIAIMGFVEVLKNLSTIKRHLKEVRQDIESFKPDQVIFIDFPGFNLRLAQKLHTLFSLHYYIAPKAWAWNKKRVHSLRKYCKTVNCILPFEVDFFKSYGVNAEYVGNPSRIQVGRYLKEHKKDKEDFIALFPGSRKQEIERILPIMLESIKQFPKQEFRISKASNLDYSVYEPFITDKKQLFENNYELLNGAKAALVTSGTATLETALFDVPQVVCYVANGISYAIAKRLVSIKYISLVNLIANKEVVTELIQDDCNPNQIARELEKILSDEGKKAILKEYKTLKDTLGSESSSDILSRKILTFSS